MDRNQLYFRYTQLGGRGVIWLFAVALSVALVRLGLRVPFAEPHALAVEVGSLLMLAAFAVLPFSWLLLRHAGRVAWGGFFLIAGVTYALIFPAWLTLELILSSNPIPHLGSATVPILLGYGIKVLLALWAGRVGGKLLCSGQSNVGAT
jgi:hypothetical protein